MATKTKKTAPAKPAPARKGGRPEGAAPERAPHSEAYEAALREYTAALDLMRKGDNARAMEQFRAVEAGSTNEPELADRARTWAALCARRMAPAAPTPRSADERYHLAVLRANEGKLDEASDLLDRAVGEEGPSARLLYARASVRALQGRTDQAVADLRGAIAGDVQFRFQAANDPDFERIRNEAAFIDVIEPTNAGA